MARSFDTRVAFFGHKLTPRDKSTRLIDGMRRTSGVPDGEHVTWLQFPFEFQGRAVDVRFYVLDLFAREVMEGHSNGTSMQALMRAYHAAVEEAKRDGITWLECGWGALTKHITNHGASMMGKHPTIENLAIHSTHGDAGTVAAVLAALRKINLPSDLSIAVVGAGGVIGRAIARALSKAFSPSKITLVGNSDRGQTNIRFLELQEISLSMQPHSCKVEISQDYKKDCRGADVVIMATTNVDFKPEHVRPEGALIIDLATPAACKAEHGWVGSESIVLKAGCARLDPKALPNGFGHDHLGRMLTDVDAGGEYVLWGCAAETIERAWSRRPGHLFGPNIPESEVELSGGIFQTLGVEPQPLIMFDQPLLVDEVMGFVRARRG